MSRPPVMLLWFTDTTAMLFGEKVIVFICFPYEVDTWTIKAIREATTFTMASNNIKYKIFWGNSNQAIQ